MYLHLQTVPILPTIERQTLLRFFTETIKIRTNLLKKSVLIGEKSLDTSVLFLLTLFTLSMTYSLFDLWPYCYVYECHVFCMLHNRILQKCKAFESYSCNLKMTTGHYNSTNYRIELRAIFLLTMRKAMLKVLQNINKYINVK